MVVVYKSATVTKSDGKLSEWNEVNPASEKPKIGRGIPIPETEGKRGRESVDKWLPLARVQNMAYKCYSYKKAKCLFSWKERDEGCASDLISTAA